MNIDGKILNEIIKNDSYKREVLDRLNYSKTIIRETGLKLEGTNFESLLKIIIKSSEQLLDWIGEYKNAEIY